MLIFVLHVMNGMQSAHVIKLILFIFDCSNVHREPLWIVIILLVTPIRQSEWVESPAKQILCKMQI